MAYKDLSSIEIQNTEHRSISGSEVHSLSLQPKSMGGAQTISVNEEACGNGLSRDGSVVGRR